jgi:hypothetical protein
MSLQRRWHPHKLQRPCQWRRANRRSGCGYRVGPGIGLGVAARADWRSNHRRHSAVVRTTGAVTPTTLLAARCTSHLRTNLLTNDRADDCLRKRPYCRRLLSPKMLTTKRLRASRTWVDVLDFLRRHHRPKRPTVNDRRESRRLAPTSEPAADAARYWKVAANSF